MICIRRFSYTPVISTGIWFTMWSWGSLIYGMCAQRGRGWLNWSSPRAAANQSSDSQVGSQTTTEFVRFAGSSEPRGTPAQLIKALTTACEYGHTLSASGLPQTSRRSGRLSAEQCWLSLAQFSKLQGGGIETSSMSTCGRRTGLMMQCYETLARGSCPLCWSPFRSAASVKSDEK